jgi:response regulator RpfG family c-di-GMP phosphodiesterase
MDPRPLILVVEDDADTLELIIQQLETEGPYATISAHTILEAHLAIARHAPDLVISDRFLQDEDGLALCRWVKEHSDHRDTMFIMLTGAHSTEEKVTGFHAGADDYITKPYQPREFMSRVRAMLRIKSMQDEVRQDRAELERLNTALASHLGAVESLLVNLIGLRVPDASTRAQKAGVFARWVGERLEMEPEELRELELSARLHEIGKVILSDDLLMQDQSPESPEYRMTLQHSPVFGQMIVGNIPELRNVGLILRHQLENYDGTGQPARLTKSEIPIASRVLRIINYVEEVARPGTRKDEIISRLQHASGTFLDPSLVRLAEEYLIAIADPGWLEGKRQLRLEDIREGMVIAADLFTASGIKLLPAGSRLSKSNIDRILSHHTSDPIINRVYVQA